MTTTDAGTSEYDRFGPWIDEVRTADDVPRLYRDHPLDLGSARLVLKVPRNVARRDATPDMDLYDHLLVLDEERLTVLSRRPDASPAPGRYDVRTVPHDQVVAVCDVVNLLDGSLTLVAGDGTALTVRYNGSARETVRRLVDELRAAASVGAPSPAGRALRDAGRSVAGARPLALGDDDLGLVADVRDVTRGLDGLTPWAWHGRRRVRPRPGLLGAVAHAVSPATLHAAVLAGDDRTLEVFGRHDWVLRGRGPVHSLSRAVVPLAAIDEVTLAAHPSYEGAVVASVRLGQAGVALVVPDGSDAHRVLDAAR